MKKRKWTGGHRPWTNRKKKMGLRGIAWESFAAEGLIKRCIV